MTALRRLWAPVLVALLVAVLVGPAGGAVMAVESRTTVRTITIPGGAFIPTNDDAGYQNDGYQVVVVGPAVDGEFTAQLFFEAPVVRIKKMVLYAYDNGGDAVCVGMYRTTPGVGWEEEMGTVCSTGDTNGVRSFTQRTFNTQRVTGHYGPYLYLWLPGTYSNGYSFYAVRITYAIIP